MRPGDPAKSAHTFAYSAFQLPVLSWLRHSLRLLRQSWKLRESRLEPLLVTSEAHSLRPLVGLCPRAESQSRTLCWRPQERRGGEVLRDATRLSSKQRRSGPRLPCRGGWDRSPGSPTWSTVHSRNSRSSRMGTSMWSVRSI